MRITYDLQPCSILMSGSIQTHCSLTYVYVLWLISHILWSVKQDHLTEYILVLVYCHSHNNNRLGIFRIGFFYASRFYYPNHVFDNLSRITIHGRFIKLIMHRNNNEIKQCLIIYISNIRVWIQCIGTGAHTNNNTLYYVHSMPLENTVLIKPVLRA